MRADDRRELQQLVEDIQALVARLQRHDQPLAMQLLEMAVIELRSRMHGIGDEEFEALVETLSGDASPAKMVELAETGEPYERPARPLPSARVVALGDVRRAKCKRRS
jgi:hypothetical protein